jgi:hypothetical protein
MTADEAHARAARSRATQGLGPTITDPETIAKVAAMVAEALAAAAPAEVEQQQAG